MSLRSFLLIGFGLICMISCVDMDHEPSEEREKLVAQGVDIRIEDFREREWEKCQARALEKAIQVADSTIRARARQDAVDPILKPPKPEKPERPALREARDSIRTDSLIGIEND